MPLLHLSILSRRQSTPICRRLLATQQQQQRITRFGEIPEMTDRKPTHIIVGAGSAGCVLANRLSEDTNNYVLLVEAGCRDDWWRWSIHMPSALMYYFTGAQKHLNDRTVFWPRGRVWGGSSSINAMVHMRGHPYDYDRWEREGATSWSYKHCLPYFKKAETCEPTSNDTYRGRDGPIHITVGECGHPLHHAFMQAGVEAGYALTDDMNGYRQEGVGRLDLSIHNGERQSTSRAYLWPILDRPNLKIASGIWVTRVLFHRRKAIGIELIPSTRLEFLGTDYIDSYAREKIYCQDSVILCGGAINTPQLMMLSGLGPGGHLDSLEIPVVQDMPGVGLNLQDHLEVYVQQRCKQSITYYNKSSLQYPHHSIPVGIEWIASKTGIGTSCHLESGAFVRRNDTVAHPDVQMHFLPSIVHDDGRRPGTCHAYQLHIGPLRSQSKGYIMLRNRDARMRPLINPNYLAFEQDRIEFRDCIRIAREIFAQNAFAEYRGDELAPGYKSQTNAEIDAFVNETASSAYHPAGTCKMGRSTDSLAVVDGETMAVHGVDNLYVADASVMPSIVSGNLNAPTVMIAERAADMIGKRTLLPAESPPIWVPTISS